MKQPIAIFLFSAMGLAFAPSAAAKDALCYTTDDGEYPCDFQRLDAAGSFRITAAGMPTFELWIEAEGRGFASAIFAPGERSVPLPGPYIRSKKDGACWTSNATDTELCAW